MVGSKTLSKYLWCPFNAFAPKIFSQNIEVCHLSNQHIVFAASMPRLFMILVNIQRINYVIINHFLMIYCVDYCLIKLKTISVGERTHTKVGLSQFKSKATAYICWCDLIVMSHTILAWAFYSGGLFFSFRNFWGEEKVINDLLWFIFLKTLKLLILYLL